MQNIQEATVSTSDPLLNTDTITAMEQQLAELRRAVELAKGANARMKALERMIAIAKGAPLRKSPAPGSKRPGRPKKAVAVKA